MTPFAGAASSCVLALMGCWKLESKGNLLEVAQVVAPLWTLMALGKATGTRSGLPCSCKGSPAWRPSLCREIPGRSTENACSHLKKREVVWSLTLNSLLAGSVISYRFGSLSEVLVCPPAGGQQDGWTGRSSPNSSRWQGGGGSRDIFHTDRLNYTLGLIQVGCAADPGGAHINT